MKMMMDGGIEEHLPTPWEAYVNIIIILARVVAPNRQKTAICPFVRLQHQIAWPPTHPSVLISELSDINTERKRNGKSMTPCPPWHDNVFSWYRDLDQPPVHPTPHLHNLHACQPNRALCANSIITPLNANVSLLQYKVSFLSHSTSPTRTHIPTPSLSREIEESRYLCSYSLPKQALSFIIITTAPSSWTSAAAAVDEGTSKRNHPIHARQLSRWRSQLFITSPAAPPKKKGF